MSSGERSAIGAAPSVRLRSAGQFGSRAAVIPALKRLLASWIFLFNSSWLCFLWWVFISKCANLRHFIYNFRSFVVISTQLLYLHEAKLLHYKGCDLQKLPVVHSNRRLELFWLPFSRVSKRLLFRLFRVELSRRGCSAFLRLWFLLTKMVVWASEKSPHLLYLLIVLLNVLLYWNSTRWNIICKIRAVTIHLPSTFRIYMQLVARSALPTVVSKLKLIIICCCFVKYRPLNDVNIRMTSTRPWNLT